MRRGSPLRDWLVRFILQNRLVMPALSDEPNSRTLCAFAFSRIKNAHPPAQEANLAKRSWCCSLTLAGVGLLMNENTGDYIVANILILRLPKWPLDYCYCSTSPESLAQFW